ncbi:hypothetical protein TRFO_14777 [Tritrichomonas foetus]|uniref:DUF3447 domain-containing protein n=1 Tax=Tritrichomonas foetus TaxID=1144522 RepID=A0A1J4KYP4_9EUKA|nr:hypothetical protein TRFO_14777 [Tritrichomonas foetus]|eukprot:OHT14830.1 hypothetical protein TRFO_14777 [Tritrichomonas foetus]
MKLSEVVQLHMSEMNDLIEVQDMLLNISQYNEEETFEYFSNSPFFESKDHLRTLLNSIIAALNSRPTNYQHYVNLISYLIPIITTFFQQEELVEEIFGHNIIRLRLLEENIIDFSQIYKYDKSESTFFFFAPEFQKYYPEYFDENKIIVRNLNMENHIIKRLEGMNESEIAIIIRNDDIEQFQSFISRTNTSLNSNIPNSFYEICLFLKNSVSLIEYAAFFGSTEIFKFLWVNNVNLPSTLCDFAVAGGNYEIVHLIESNKSLKYSSDNLLNAILFHRNDIAHYLNDTIGLEYTFDVLAQCIMAYNIEIFVEICHLADDDINMGNEWGWTALHFATMHNRFDLVKLLCQVEGIDVMSRNNVYFVIFIQAFLLYFLFNSFPLGCLLWTPRYIEILCR